MPTVFGEIVEGLGRHDLNHGRIVIEKPYGRDLQSAQALDDCVHAVFDESQVYRIDHYLGKETVQNVLALRFANAIFEPIWNRRYVDHVQITVAEEIGVEHRGSFYETAGALRDIVQNHVMQVLALTGHGAAGRRSTRRASATRRSRRCAPCRSCRPSEVATSTVARPVPRLHQRGGRRPGQSGRDLRRHAPTR